MDYYDPMMRFNRFSGWVLLVCALTLNAQAADKKPAVPLASALDSALFYQLLLGELNVRGGDPGAAYSLMLDAARKTNDPRLYQRSVEIALQARSGDSALLAARAWKQAQPASKQANRYILQILIALNRIGETLEPLKREVAASEPQERSATVLAIPHFFARASDKKLASSTVAQALADYLNAPGVSVAAWTVVGRMRFEAGDVSGALDAARRAQAIDAQSEQPALLALALLSPQQPQAEVLIKNYLASEKPETEIRMAYSRALLERQRYPEARAQLAIITTEKPDFAPAWLIRGALDLQYGQPTEAQRSLKRYLELALAQRNEANRAELTRGINQAYLSLAQIAEQEKDYAAAHAWLNRIEGPDQLLNAQLRRAAILARQGQLDAARLLIRSQPEKSAADARLKIATEVQLLRDSQQHQAAYDLLAQASARTPEDMDLVYDLAMAAEKLGQSEEMERLLRQVIASKPDYHHAYNALGYSLAERNIRLHEARQLILTALAYAPNEPFITDSLGWVEFRLGNLDEAARLLAGAFKASPDAEIAAHLGEVLWALGRREQAVRIWQEGVQLNALNETLLETLKRLRVKL